MTLVPPLLPVDERIMYIAHPTRLRGRGDEFCDHAYRLGYSPVNPFGGGKYKYFEGGRLGREATLNHTKNIQRTCGATGVYGVSDGVLIEVDDRLTYDSENIRIFYGFDDLFDESYELLKDKYCDPFKRLRGKNWLIAFVAVGALGRAQFMHLLQERFGPDKLRFVKNTTTRDPRSPEDNEVYHFVTRDQFEAAIRNFHFLEHDKYSSNYYGSSLGEIKKSLKTCHGMAAFTPKGIEALYQCRFEINCAVIYLRPSSEEVLREQLRQKNITDRTSQDIIIWQAKEFVVNRSIPHQVVEITGNMYLDIDRLTQVVGTIIH